MSEAVFLTGCVGPVGTMVPVGMELLVMSAHSRPTTTRYDTHIPPSDGVSSQLAMTFVPSLDAYTLLSTSSIPLLKGG